MPSKQTLSYKKNYEEKTNAQITTFTTIANVTYSTQAHREKTTACCTRAADKHKHKANAFKGSQKDH